MKADALVGSRLARMKSTRVQQSQLRIRPQSLHPRFSVVGSRHGYKPLLILSSTPIPIAEENQKNQYRRWSCQVPQKNPRSRHPQIPRIRQQKKLQCAQAAANVKSEDQVQLSQNNHRASFHMKSQSEPNHAVPGLLTPQQYDEQGHPTNQDPHHPSMHARGVSSASQVQSHAKPAPTSGQYHRGNQRSQQIWDGWSHNMAYGLSSDDQSPPMSVTTDTSLEEEDVDDLWDTFERLNLAAQRRPMGQPSAPLRSSRRNDSTSTTLTSTTYNLDSDTDDSSYHHSNQYSSSSDFDQHDTRKASEYHLSSAPLVGQIASSNGVGREADGAVDTRKG